jgi:hypothetical protein
MVSCLGRGFRVKGQDSPGQLPSLSLGTCPANPLLQGGQQLVWLRALLALDHLLPAQSDDVAQGLRCIGMLLGRGETAPKMS